MALNFDDKILGEKYNNYCSSSEDDDDDGPKFVRCDPSKPDPVGTQPKRGSQTGVKGVINDWREFKRMEAEARDECAASRHALATKLSMTCRSYLDDEADSVKAEAASVFNTETDPDSADVLAAYRLKRLQELREKYASTNQGGCSEVHGEVYRFGTGDELNACLHAAKPNLEIIVLLHEDTRACLSAIDCFSSLAKSHPTSKFVRIAANQVGMSEQFCKKGVPALQVYSGGDAKLVLNKIAIHTELGSSFYASDIESILQESGCLQDACLDKVTRSLQNRVGKKNVNSALSSSDEDSDFDLD